VNPWHKIKVLENPLPAMRVNVTAVRGVEEQKSHRKPMLILLPSLKKQERQVNH
jgi:hypothetical protein